ncbi:hypothetical protein PR202_ga30057 [Eleusine coracana subsp. coracana]|uniref:Uncharacterized protein n=1 Tax=Eleusine coracana subsp. coracana TaxID=191504 RepID=A0AAV5DPL1_ELECO|nr:hypothetical protein PR202_ga30057 [Eleusine coracana subsp. coracana]
MTVDIPQWAHKVVDKIRRGYLWKGYTDVKGGQCLVAWNTVCHPLEQGGLGISILQHLSWALRLR